MNQRVVALKQKLLLPEIELPNTVATVLGSSIQKNFSSMNVSLQHPMFLQMVLSTEHTSAKALTLCSRFSEDLQRMPYLCTSDLLLPCPRMLQRTQVRSCCARCRVDGLDEDRSHFTM
jgi:hypothetical protein